MHSLKTCFFKKQFVCLLAVLLLLPTANAFASTNANISSNGTIEVQAMVQEGFIEPITVELSGKDNYVAKLLVSADNNYVLRKQLPNGNYTVIAVYTNTKAESDSQMWASSETVEITQGKTSVLNIAVLDDSSSNAEILFGEENNPFLMNTADSPADFMKENAAKLEEQQIKNSQLQETQTNVKNDETQNKIMEGENNPSINESQYSAEEDQKIEAQSAWDKLIDLIIRLARYILLCVFVMVGVSVIVWVYRRMKYRE